MIDTTTASRMLIIGSIGVAIGINLIIAGLIVIAIHSDGQTAIDIAGAFQTALIAAISGIGTLAGIFIHGKLTTNAIQQTQAAQAVVQDTVHV